MRTDRERPFKFTIEVEAVDETRWIARVDTDDGNEKSFLALSRVGAAEKAEAFCEEWALEQPDARRAYSYDYSPPVSDRKPA